MARPETKIAEILWRAGSSPTCGTMAPSNEGEDLEQCPISPPSGGRSRAQIAHLGKVFCHSTAHVYVHYTLYNLANIYTNQPYQLPWLIDTIWRITKLNASFF